METRELPPPPWPLPSRAARPVETRRWRKDIPTRTVKRFLLLCFLVLLGGCVAMCAAQNAEGEAGRRRAVAALEQIDVPGRTEVGQTRSRGCDDYQYPHASRTDRSNLSSEQMGMALAADLVRVGWTKIPGSAHSRAAFSRGELQLSLVPNDSPGGSTILLRIDDTSTVC